ncbi:MAG TPA: hypothetical protein VLH75_05285 [Longimicrobiales bacterium]|nr:hypothetical protein [Longimicrobiales bacterium]
MSIRLCRAFALAVALGASPWVATEAGAQVRWRDLVLTMGGSVEGYSGNFSAVNVSRADSAEHVVAVVGELGMRGALVLAESRTRSFEISFDGGMRQAAAFGFQRQDYSPREWVGSAAGRYTQSAGSWGTLLAQAGVRGRAVRDRPLSTIFIQPGYTNVQGSVGVRTRSFDGVTFDAQVDLESADYQSVELVPQLDLLDRTSSGIEAGVRWGGPSTMRFYGGFRWTDHGNQVSFDPDDPYRRDHTTRVGMEWAYDGEISAQVGVDGTVNRSNSNRPEYDAVSARAVLTAPLSHEMSLNVYALLTAKSYVHDTDFPRLVPGEEADNASLAYLQVSRPVAVNLDAAFRLAWTRAETYFGSAYYQRLGASVQFNYRPRGF